MDIFEELKKLNKAEPGEPKAHFMGRAWCSNENSSDLGFIVTITEKTAEGLEAICRALKEIREGNLYNAELKGITLKIPRGMDVDVFDVNMVETYEDNDGLIDISANQADVFPSEYPADDRGMIDMTLSTFNTCSIMLYSKYSSDMYSFEVDVRELLDRTRAQINLDNVPRM